MKTNWINLFTIKSDYLIKYTWLLIKIMLILIINIPILIEIIVLIELALIIICVKVLMKWSFNWIVVYLDGRLIKCDLVVLWNRITDCPRFDSWAPITQTYNKCTHLKSLCFCFFLSFSLSFFVLSVFLSFSLTLFSFLRLLSCHLFCCLLFLISIPYPFYVSSLC